MLRHVDKSEKFITMRPAMLVVQSVVASYPQYLL